MKNIRIYLDDVRTPIDKDWIVVRNFYEFINLVNKVGLKQIELISLDHDLDISAIKEYFFNVSKNYILDYNNIVEKTGYDVSKWLVNKFYEENPKRKILSRSDKKLLPFNFPRVVVHSANPIGSANIMGIINNFLLNEDQEEDCIRVKIEHTE